MRKFSDPGPRKVIMPDTIEPIPVPAGSRPETNAEHFKRLGVERDRATWRGDAVTDETLGQVID